MPLRARRFETMFALRKSIVVFRNGNDNFVFFYFFYLVKKPVVAVQFIQSELLEQIQMQ